MDKNALLYYNSACDLQLPARIIPDIDGFDIVLGKQRYFFRGGETPYNSGASVSVAANKYCMNKILQHAGFPVPLADAFQKKDLENTPVESLISALHFPLVVKPMNATSCGKDVLCNITNIAQLEAYLNQCYQRHQFLTVEEFHGGLASYRVLVFYNQVIGVVQRFPAAVVGDGIHTINELIAIENVAREQVKDSVSSGPIQVDDEYRIRLAELEMTLNTIPKEQERVVLCYTCNSTRGGTMTSLGTAICKENAQLLCRAARALNLNIVGFDVQCEDIRIPIEKSRGVIIEANHNPDISIHEAPMGGLPNPVSKKILRRLIRRHPLAYCAGVWRKHRNAAAL